MSDRFRGDEAAVLGLVRERLELGRMRYGDLDLMRDQRDRLVEGLEEALDLSIYLAAELLRLRRLREETENG